VFFGGTCLPQGVQQASVMRILRAELSPNPAFPLDPWGPPITAVDVVLSIEDCTMSPPSVRIVLWQGTERRERTVDLSDVPPDDWTRALALALAETRADPTVSRSLPAAPPPWAMPPALVAQPPVPVPPPPNPEDPDNPDPKPDEDPYRDTAGAEASRGKKTDSPPLTIRVALGFRFATRTGTPAAGVTPSLGWRQFGFGLSLYGARSTVDIGDITLWVPAAVVSYDLLEWGGYYRLRTSLDLGGALGTGTPTGTATGKTELAPHVALHAGVAASWPIGASTDVEGGLALGYASSLRGQVNSVDVIGMDGLLMTAELGLRLR
jgi:hypothetical protein